MILAMVIMMFVTIDSLGLKTKSLWLTTSVSAENYEPTRTFGTNTSCALCILSRENELYIIYQLG